MRLTTLALIILGFIGCGDGLSRGIVITGDGTVGANNARNERLNVQTRLRTALEDDLGAGWQAGVVIAELPVWTEDRGVVDGAFEWEQITATVELMPPAGTNLPETKKTELEAGLRTYLAGRLTSKGPKDRVALSLQVVAAPVVAPPVAQVRGARTYAIQAGDTLADISTVFYGSPQAWRRILDANPGLDPAQLPPGQEIVIPPVDPQAE